MSWKISTDDLNTLWKDCWPRVVAQCWANSEDPITRINTYPSTTSPLDEFLLLAGALPGTACTASHLTALVGYLDGSLPSASAGIVPIRWIPGGGYDFLISDRGIDLFAPPQPQKLWKLLDYFTFRPTGRKPIGLPFYRSGGNAIDMPTGPSQMRMTWADVGLVIQQNAPDGNAAADAVECLAKKLGVWNEELERLVKVLRRQDDPEAWLAVLIEGMGEMGSDQLPMTFDGVKCMLSGFRKWQVEGSVYRGIMTELPRVVAEIWLSEEIDSEGGGSWQADPESYASMFSNGADDGLRDIFRQRLETSLPTDAQMKFEVDNAPGYAYITHEGFFFPPAGDTWTQTGATQSATGGGGPPPTDPRLIAFFQEIAAGRAGNPVFTDCMEAE